MSSISDTERIGQLVLGRYRVVRRLAQGGMGVVYLGRLEGAAGFAKPVVIKRIISDPDDQQGSTARFIREAQILSNLQHPGIVGVLDFGEEDELYSMVLEYVQGYDLGRWLKYLQLKAQAMSWQEAVFIILRVLEALSYAHDFRRNDGTPAEILHRDISPGNILLDVDGRVRLVDFGIARMDASAGDLYKTQTGVLKGKITYMAPELFGGRAGDEFSDLYALGVTVYRMFTAAYPYGEIEPFSRPRFGKPANLSRYRPDLPAWLDAVIGKAQRCEAHAAIASFTKRPPSMMAGRCSPCPASRARFFSGSPSTTIRSACAPGAMQPMRPSDISSFAALIVALRITSMAGSTSPRMTNSDD